MEEPTNSCRSYSVSMGSRSLELEPCYNSVEPIPYKCSLDSISELKLYDPPKKFSTEKFENRRKRNKFTEKQNSPIEAELLEFDPTTDLLYMASIAQSHEERFHDWESLQSDNPSTSSEVRNKAVVSECGNGVVNHLRTIALERLLTIATPRDLEVYIPSHHNIELNQLKKDIGFLMVGIESHSFPYSDKKNSFLPRKGLSADGVTPEALESFSTPFMTCGNIVKKLSLMTETSSGRGRIYEGFVYGVKNFLKLHQNLVSNLAKSQNGGRFFQLARQLMKHVVFVSKLCNLDKANIEEHNYLAIPKGMDLLLYLLSQTRHISQTDLELLSISILRATINPYLKFLSSWLFHGICNSADIEFGIQSNERFLDIRDRGFWVNAYTSQFDQMLSSAHPIDRPLDIIYLTTKVVACGKALNLLRICKPSHPLCIDEVTFRSKLEIVVTPSQERNLRLACQQYMTEMTGKMKKNHMQLELQRKAETNKVSSTYQTPIAPKSVDTKRETTTVAYAVQSSLQESKTYKIESIRDILPEKDETLRIDAIKTDLISYYNGEESKSEQEHSSLDSKDQAKKLPLIEGEELPKLPKHITNLAAVKEKVITKEHWSKTEETVNYPLKKKHNNTNTNRADELLPTKKVDLIIAAKEKTTRRTAQSIIASQNQAPQNSKLSYPTKSVDECIATADSKVMKYTFKSLNIKPAAVKTNVELPTSTKGLAPLELLVKNSIHIPLMTQLTLINKEILHFFLVDQNLLKNLAAISNYILLKDNEFAFNLGYGLSDAMEDDTLALQKNPTILSRILRNAIHSSSAASVDPLALNVGFSINQIINAQELHCSDIIDMLRLSYAVQWPLNIIITPDMINSYGQIFQLLLRMENVSITLNKTFMHLKQYRYLFRDFRFVQLQVIRHRMLNYIIIIQTYIRNQIVVACWQEFQSDLKNNVTCLDTLWNAHSKYINKLLSRAFVYKETQPIRNILMKTLDTVAVFTRLLQHKNLICTDDKGDNFVNNEVFEDMKNTYNTFHHLLSLFTSIVSKLETKGYKYHLQELLACLRIASACGTASKI